MQVRKLRQYVPLTREQFRAGDSAAIDTLIGYYEPYATSHDQLDATPEIFTEVENAARSLVNFVRAVRSGTCKAPDAGLRHPRQK